MIKITIPFRLHINLLAMHSCNYRKNGGIGLSIINENIFLESSNSLSNTIKVIGYCSDFEKVDRIVALLNKVQCESDLSSGISIFLYGDYFFHVGLGVGTAVTLACLEALFLNNDVKISNEELVKISERGGTSGVGINTYFNGGFIIDGGIKPNHNPHRPSSEVKPDNYPKILARCEFPNWKFCIVIPKEREEMCGVKELDFFISNCPIPKEDAYYASYLAFLGTFASVNDHDYELFCDSINDTKNTYWKKKEISENPSILKLINKLLLLGADCAGMSSFGNSIYFFYKKSESIDLFMKDSGFIFMEFNACNSGRIIC